MARERGEEVECLSKEGQTEGIIGVKWSLLVDGGKDTC